MNSHTLLICLLVGLIAGLLLGLWLSPKMNPAPKPIITDIVTVDTGMIEATAILPERPAKPRIKYIHDSIPVPAPPYDCSQCYCEPETVKIQGKTITPRKVVTKTVTNTVYESPSSVRGFLGSGVMLFGDNIPHFDIGLSFQATRFQFDISGRLQDGKTGLAIEGKYFIWR